jgi:serine protease Do
MLIRSRSRIMAPFKNLPAILCAGLLFSPMAFGQEAIQTGTQQGQAAPPPSGKIAYHPGPPVTEGGQPVTDDLEIFFHIQEEAAALITAQKVTFHDELLRQLNAAPDHVDLNIAAVPLSLTPRWGLYEACKRGVLVVAGINKGRVSPAGGIVLTADGIAVTNYHVVEQDNTTLVAMTSDQRVVPVKAVLAASKQYDLAIIQLDGRGFSPLPLTSGAPVGSDIYSLTHPSGHFYYLGRGIISRRAMSGHRPGEEGVPVLEITADYARGSSGCPILDAAGQVVGMVKDTMSVYYTEVNGNQRDLQMVFKDCVTSEEILKMVSAGDAQAGKK